jgi:hypothetical protein
MQKKKRDPFRQFAEIFFRPSPLSRFMTSRWGHCRVPGCKTFAGKKPLCYRHQGSTKFQHLAQR